MAAPRNDNFPYPGLHQADIYNVRQSHVASSTAIDFGAHVSTIEIFNETGASDLHISLSGATATTDMFIIPAGQKFTYRGPLLKAIKFISSGTTGKFNVIAY